MKGSKMSNSTAAAAAAFVTDEMIDAVRDLSTNSVGRASIDFYTEVLSQAGIDPETLSFAEAVEVTRKLYAASADYRRAQADVAKAEREAEREVARQAREEAKKARLAAEKEAILAKLAKLEGK